MLQNELNLDFQSTSKYAVLVFTYRKHNALKEIFNAIIEYNPKKLYISQNFPQNNDDIPLTEKVREVINLFNFPCETEFIFREQHLHTTDIFHNTIEYVFSHEDEIIVLEDDTVPSPDFFNFCAQMLVDYKNNEMIGCINGCNLNATHIMNQYFLSGLSLPYWGWATWKSKWELHKKTIIPWEKRAKVFLPYISQSNRAYFEHFFGDLKNVSPTWDIQWNWVLLLNNQSTIIPGVNLITNKGFSQKGTYTTYSNSKFRKLKRFNFDQTKRLQLSSDNNHKVSYEKSIAQLLQEIMNRDNINKNFLSLLKNWIKKK
jgi:hypothetical protein